MAAVNRTDEELAARASLGDREAFEILADRLIRPVRGFLYRLGTEEADLDDRTQEVFAVLISRLGQWRRESRFTTWVLGIALNVHRAARRRGGPVGASFAPPHDLRSEPRRIVESREELEALKSAVATLPDLYRETFVLRVLEQRDVSEVARILGVPESTVRRRAHEALRRVAARVRDFAPAPRRAGGAP